MVVNVYKYGIMKQICKFDSKRDLQMTTPSLSTSIRLAIESGVVMDTGIDCLQNDIDDPSNIWGRIDDVFTALDVQKKMMSQASSKSNVIPSQPARGETE